MMTVKFIDKQFQLLFNVLQGYKEQIRRRQRQRLVQRLQEKKNYITEIIDGDPLVTERYNHLCKAAADSIAP